MTLNELLLRVADSFHQEKVPVLLIGGLAVSSWIEPRATQDMDVIVKVKRRDAARLKRALLATGARITSLELRILLERRFVRFPMGGPTLDVRLENSTHDRDAFRRAKALTYEGRKLLVATPEDLVLYKLIAWRPVDQRDILSFLEQRKDLNRRYISSRLSGIEEETSAPMQKRWREIQGGDAPRTSP